MSTANQNKEQIISEEFSISKILETLWQGRWTIIVVALVFALGFGIYSVLTPSIYTAQVTMLPQGEKDNVGLLGKIASITGTPMGGNKSYEGLYQEILQSDAILDQLVNRRWMSLPLGKESTLYEILKIDVPDTLTPSFRLSEFKLKKALRNDVIFFHRNKINGYMTLQVSLPNDPPLAAEMANFLVSLLDKYNRHFRTSKAKQQREFVSKRLNEVNAELSAAENEMTVFLKSNRNYSSSPELVQKHNNLDRHQRATITIWTELRRQLELAKIDEHKESVSVDILDLAKAPVVRSKPNRPFLVLFGAFLGFMISALYVLARQQWQSRY